MENGDQAPVIDNKGRRRGLKQWVVCPSCEIGRWVRIDGVIKKTNTGFCPKCHNKYRTLHMEEHGSWKGGRVVRKDGYVDVHLTKDDPFYPMTRVDGYIREHRLVMARHLGRCLFSWEVVHHLNGNRSDNRIENLQLLSNKNTHMPSMVVQATIKRMQKKIDSLEGQLIEAHRQLKTQGYEIITEAEEIVESKSQKIKHYDNSKQKGVQYTLWQQGRETNGYLV
jgi:hypothetical protein